MIHVLSYNLKIVLMLTIGFVLASLLGYLSHRIKLSPILGYLLAGYFIGPYSPGFVAELETSEQLAEIGVILMMFGVGLHFKWDDLFDVKWIAIPGAIGQTLITTVLGALFINYLGWSIEAGVVVGLAIAVASTVVLVRVLSDNKLLNTTLGHISVGWLVVEDILTVIALALLPTLASFMQGESLSLQKIFLSTGEILLKFIALVAFMFTIGRRFVSYIFVLVARTRSQELFTLTILASTFGIATGSALLFGSSIALGAFIAGMMIGQTDVKHQASANALPLKDAFAVIFFLTVGMLFDPSAISHHFTLFMGILSIILIFKPLVATLIVLALGSPFKTALTVAIALAQIGEFSFILAEEALKLQILPNEGYDVIVACALISVSINPICFKMVELLFSRSKRHQDPVSFTPMSAEKDRETLRQSPDLKAIVVGYGSIGEAAVEVLNKVGVVPTVIDQNVDIITRLLEENQSAVYGDASHPNILESAHIESCVLLVVTIPEVLTTQSILAVARKLQPHIQMIAKIPFSKDQSLLKETGAEIICCEEEMKKSFEQAILDITRPLKLDLRSNYP